MGKIYKFLEECYTRSCGIFDMFAGVGEREGLAMLRKVAETPESEPATKDDFDRYIEGLEERLDRMFNERAIGLERQVGYDQEEIMRLMKKANTQTEKIGSLETELATRKSFYEAEKESRTEGLGQKDEELARLRKSIQDISETAGERAEKRADAWKAAYEEAHGELEKARQGLEGLKRTEGSHHRVKLLGAVIKMKSAGKQAYLTEVGLVEDLLDWARSAEEAGLDFEYVDQVISCLRNGCGENRKDRRRILSGLLATKDYPGSALGALSRYNPAK